MNVCFIMDYLYGIMNYIQRRIAFLKRANTTRRKKTTTFYQNVMTDVRSGSGVAEFSLPLTLCLLIEKTSTPPSSWGFIPLLDTTLYPYSLSGRGSLALNYTEKQSTGIEVVNGHTVLAAHATECGQAFYTTKLGAFQEVGMKNTHPHKCKHAHTRTQTVAPHPTGDTRRKTGWISNLIDT